MKKLISVMLSLITVMIFWALPSAAYSAGINDMAELYKESELAALEERQAEVAEATGWNIAVVTTDVGFGEDGIAACDFAEGYCYDIFGGDPDSVVYLIDLDYRWISIGGDMYNYFDSERFDKMMDECEECYRDYRDVDNLETFYYYLEYYKGQGTVEYDPSIGHLGDDFEDSITYYDDYGNELTMSERVETLFACLAAGVVVSAITILIIVSRYKFHYVPSANAYLNKDTMNMYCDYDTFVREYTTRTRINSSSGSSGGGGRSSRSGGRSRGGGGRGGRR